jgi:SpoVK/Ycf46/Vps4 family AAA+-type ATPase
MDRTNDSREWIAKIAEAGLAGDRQRLELLLVSVIRTLKRDAPELSKELGTILSQYTSNSLGLRGARMDALPADRDEGLSLAQVERVEHALPPIFAEAVTKRIGQFLQERRESSRLVAEGFQPPGSVLLTGAPGTGKTVLARWFAHALDLPLVTLDLATSISSFLGKTGLNLRRILDYARERECLLLLDEFDALAKRRDDSTELGELKRIVNVLLKELEVWPRHSVLVAATNHPELLDPAVRRRFHLVLSLPLPSAPERAAILSRAAGRFESELPDKLLSVCADALSEVSGSDLENFMHASVRFHLATNVPLVKAMVGELHERWADRLAGKSGGVLMRAISSGSEKHYTVRELASIFKKSTSTVQHHLNKERTDG